MKVAIPSARGWANPNPTVTTVKQSPENDPKRNGVEFEDFGTGRIHLVFRSDG